MKHKNIKAIHFDTQMLSQAIKSIKLVCYDELHTDTEVSICNLYVIYEHLYINIYYNKRTLLFLISCKHWVQAKDNT